MVPCARCGGRAYSPGASSALCVRCAFLKIERELREKARREKRA